MLVKDALGLDVVEDGWYDMDEDERLSLWVEGGTVRRGTVPDQLGRKPVYPYVRMGDGRTYTSASSATLDDVWHGRVVMM